MNRKFSQQLNLISDLIKTKLGNNLISIILIGGYGRDEGTFFLKNKTISLVNDIDLVIISHRSMSKSILKQLMDQAAKIIKPDTQYVHEKYCPIDFHVDLFNFKKKDLSGFKPSQFSLDLKYASQVIYGNKNILRLIPELKAENIPVNDGLMLLHNRVLSLLEAYQSGQSEWIYYFSLKAIIDSSVAILIKEKQYSPYHKLRMTALKKLKPQSLAIFQRYAAKRYLIKSSDLINYKKHWSIARKVLLETLDQYPHSFLARLRPSSIDKIKQTAVRLLKSLPLKIQPLHSQKQIHQIIDAWKRSSWE